MLEELGRAPPAFGREGDDVVEMRGGVTQAEGGEGVNQVAHWTAPRRVAGSATRRRRLTDAAGRAGRARGGRAAARRGAGGGGAGRRPAGPGGRRRAAPAPPPAVGR